MRNRKETSDNVLLIFVFHLSDIYMDKLFGLKH